MFNKQSFMRNFSRKLPVFALFCVCALKFESITLLKRHHLIITMRAKKKKFNSLAALTNANGKFTRSQSTAIQRRKSCIMTNYHWKDRKKNLLIYNVVSGIIPNEKKKEDKHCCSRNIQKTEGRCIYTHI